MSIALALPGIAGTVHGGTGPAVSPAASPSDSLTIEFSDFFNIPFGEHWDYRLAIYADSPIGAECFSQEGIANGICVPGLAGVPDVVSYPYTYWYAGVGIPNPGNPNSDPWVLAPYRMRATAVNAQGYSLAEPVYFPVLNPSAAAGSRLEFSWEMHYVGTAETLALEASGCPIGLFDLDGYQLRSQIQLTMDLQESRRLFGVVGGTAAEAQGWWNSNTNPSCFTRGAAETALQNWFVAMGGASQTLGKYDIYNAFEWFYQPFYTQMGATVAADGTTTVMIDHMAWGTEVLLGRFFYWGAASYIENYLDSTKAAGWWGMEISWFDNFMMSGSFSANAHSFSLDTAMQYHFQNLALPGEDGMLNRIGDVGYWSWAPMLVDYVNDFSPKHLISELDRIPGATLVQTTPGHPKYGQSLGYDFTPDTWDLQRGDTIVYRLPTNSVVVYDPNLTPRGAHPQTSYIGVAGGISLLSTKPDGWGTYDPATNTLTVVGPARTGGPSNAPRDYGLESWPEIRLGVSAAPPPEQMRADLVGRSAYPERHHFDLSKDADGVQTLYARVGNLGNTEVAVYATFQIVDADGNIVATLQTGTVTLGLGEKRDISAGWTSPAVGRYIVHAWATFDSDGDGTPDMPGLKMKRFSFAVVP